MSDDHERTKLNPEWFKVGLTAVSTIVSAAAVVWAVYYGVRELRQQTALTLQAKVAEIVDHSSTNAEALARLRLLSASTGYSIPLTLAKQLDVPGKRFDTRDEARRRAFFDAISRTGISPADTVRVYRLLFPGASWSKDPLLDHLGAKGSYRR